MTSDKKVNLRTIKIELSFMGNSNDPINADVKQSLFQKDDSINTNEIIELMKYGGLHNHELFHSAKLIE